MTLVCYYYMLIDINYYCFTAASLIQFNTELLIIYVHRKIHSFSSRNKLEESYSCSNTLNVISPYFYNIYV